MRIVIEGCDGTGKTTLAKILADKYGLDYCHCTSTDPGDYDFYKNTVRKDNVVWDRHTIGELIYPKVFNRPQQITAEDARLVVGYGREVDTRFIVLTCSEEEIYSRLKARGNEHPNIMKHISFINDAFCFYAKEFHIPILDTSKMSLDDIFAVIEVSQQKIMIHK